MEASYSAVPFMFTVAPRGATNKQTANNLSNSRCQQEGAQRPSLEHPLFSSAQRSVTGSAADDESVPKAVTSASVKPLVKVIGFFLVCKCGRT